MEWINGMNGMNEWINEWNECMNEWINDWNECMNGISEWMEWMIEMLCHIAPLEILMFYIYYNF